MRARPRLGVELHPARTQLGEVENELVACGDRHGYERQPVPEHHERVEAGPGGASCVEVADPGREGGGVGLEAVALVPMGWGIDWMIAVAQWVAALPGAIGRVESATRSFWGGSGRSQGVSASSSSEGSAGTAEA
mgnify:CR=1 FL=1